MLKSRIQGFLPIISKSPRILILGSMPGVPSLNAREYYGHPQNVFWRIISDTYDMPITSYAEKAQIILSNNLALWDVIQSCERVGSSDAKIRHAQINDFCNFFSKYTNIEYVIFNGKEAEKRFKKGVHQTNRLSFTQLPSTSPLNARLSYQEKYELWRAALMNT